MENPAIIKATTAMPQAAPSDLLPAFGTCKSIACTIRSYNRTAEYGISGKRDIRKHYFNFGFILITNPGFTFYNQVCSICASVIPVGVVFFYRCCVLEPLVTRASKLKHSSRL